MYQRKGLQYSVLDDIGNPIGVPIKASALSGKPTLKTLEKRFEKNKVKPKRLKEDLIFRIAGALIGPAPLTADTFTKKLREREVDVVFRKNENEFVYGVTFVDHKNRIAFNGSQLGKAFSAKAILDRFAGKRYGSPAVSAPEKSAGLANKDQPKKVEEVHPNQTKSAAHHTLNLESTL